MTNGSLDIFAFQNSELSVLEFSGTLNPDECDEEAMTATGIENQLEVTPTRESLDVATSSILTMEPECCELSEPKVVNNIMKTNRQENDEVNEFQFKASVLRIEIRKL